MLAGSGTYISALTSRVTVPGNVSTYVDSASGTWLQAGNSITFTSEDGSAGTGIWDKGVLTLPGATGTTTSTFVYKQK